MADNGFENAVSPLRVFGSMLRFYRTTAGLAQTDLGARVHFSGDLVSKIEMGQRLPTPEFTAACDAVPELATIGALTELRTLMKDAIKNRTLPGWFQDWRDKEALAAALRWFELVTVPGLLQTEDYARAVLRTQVMATDDQIEEMVKARMERQAILARDKPPMLWVILTEIVLRIPVGGARVMRDQVARLLDLGTRPNVVIQVIPASVGAHEGFRGPFTIADFAGAPSAGYQDTAVRGQVIEASEDVNALAVMWETLKAEALPRSASRELMEEVARSWTSAAPTGARQATATATAETA
jgi:transcriptional regulator with XRE-family HTH domain